MDAAPKTGQWRVSVYRDTRQIAREWRLLLLLLLLALLFACKKAPQFSPLPPGSVVLAFGDSVTYGTGAGVSEDWPTRLEQASGWHIINAGVPGDTTLKATARIKESLTEHRPALVLIELGGNDFLRGRQPAAVKEDLRTILKAVKNSGAQAVLIAIPEPSILGALTRRPADADLYAELGKEENVPVIAGVFSDVLADPILRTDPIHPNAQGYQEMANGIGAALKKLSLLRS